MIVVTIFLCILSILTNNLYLPFRLYRPVTPGGQPVLLPFRAPPRTDEENKAGLSHMERLWKTKAMPRMQFVESAT